MSLTTLVAAWAFQLALGGLLTAIGTFTDPAGTVAAAGVLLTTITLAAAAAVGIAIAGLITLERVERFLRGDR